MIFNKKVFSFLLVLLSFSAQANVDKAWSYLVKSSGSVKYYPNVINELVEEKLYFASIPYIKELLTRGNSRSSKELDSLIDKVVTNVGVRQFEVLPTKFLAKSNAPTLKYILAKKYFRQGKYDLALKSLNGTIPKNHPAKPFALFLEGSIFTITKKYKSSLQAYNECISASESANSYGNENRKTQLSINRDYCIVGKARTNFSTGQYEKANLDYLDLSKSSHIWPEVLFEEAWNSFYMRDYNRTLGKLVTYKSPFLSFIHNPEIDVLSALTFMELCLWQDTLKVVDEFYANNEKDHAQIRGFLNKHRKDYKYFYLLAKSRMNGKVRGNKLLNKMLNSINRDPAYREIFDFFQTGKDELEIINKLPATKMKSILKINLREALILQRNLIGAYVRKKLHLSWNQVNKTFVDMSYIKLEVLSRRKESLYSSEVSMNRGRGDVKNLKRTDKQYFWTFNGEFWADELGDYVFSLKSECNGNAL
ncbi:tetratricopeptide repeat protein [Halobacteriovorax sp. HLS]|uniref:tetratricopeptide repeat protein n=1 Tax=Halobacteriovorax sp. HLS TaxID=2234000 RepID=UPI000FD93564|nr:tetratricopeptide repeat protein [Halobacteriovorax sp. HLS]